MAIDPQLLLTLETSNPHLQPYHQISGCAHVRAVYLNAFGTACVIDCESAIHGHQHIAPAKYMNGEHKLQTTCSLVQPLEGSTCFANLVPH